MPRQTGRGGRGALRVLPLRDVSRGKAYMKFDECWYCMPCEKDCPTGAVHVDIPYLLR